MRCSNCGTETPRPAIACETCHTPFPRTSASDSETVAGGDLSPDAPTVAFEGKGSDETVAHPPGSPGGGGPAREGTRFEIGSAFGSRYRIMRELGAGGMGVVYQAWDGELGVPVALKVIRAEVNTDPYLAREVERRFKRELLLARQVTHGNVVRIYDLGEVDGIKYITMSFVEGVDLATLIHREGRLPVPRALRMVRGIVSGLRAAHDAGVVHRDLKPANIMIDEQDEAQIMDFGIARSTSRPADPQAPRDGASKLFELRQQAALMTGTMEGGVVGTVEYMAPEQARGQEVDQRADLYALGLIVYDMLGGAGRAARSDSALVELTGRMHQPPAAIRTLNADVPEPLARVIARCLEPDATARYATARELEADLDRLDENGNLLPVLRRVSTRQIAAAGVLTLALLAGTWWFARTPPLAQQHEPVPVLVTDFDNRSGDPAFDGSIEQTLAIALERAPYISVFKTKDARAIAARLAPDRSSRITKEVGQLIARRESIKVLIDGSVERESGGYRIDVRAIDPVTGKPIETATRSVSDKTQVLPAVESVARNVREALGESKSEMTKVGAAETVTASSLEAMSAYVRGQELNYSGHQAEALKAFQEAVALDPGLARAYSGMGVIYGALKQDAKVEESYRNALKHLDRMTDREKYRTLGGYYLLVSHNYEKAIENYENLVRLYPADDTGHANLAYAYLNVRNVPRAVEEGRKAIEIYPNNTLQRTNYAMFSMYAGDFATAIREANTVLQANPSYEYAMLTVANSQLGAGDFAASRGTWTRLAALSPLGASMASLGQADLAMTLARDREASRILQEGIKTDEAAQSGGEAAAKYVALAEASQAIGDRSAAVRYARKAASLREHESVLFPAAMVLAESGNAGDAEFATTLAAKLENMLQSQTSSYSRLILGHSAFKQKRLGDALTAFRDAQKLHDSWFAHLMLGRVYLEAGRFAEAVAELDTCVKRKGEVTDVFFENLSTSRYLPHTYYWLARAQEGLGASAAAKASYEQFLKWRSEPDTPDPLAADARARVKAL
jgi:serine/threonine protein kinase/tetratricopeptide (TPR) repeat protein